MKAYTRPAQIQTTQNPSTEKGNGTKSPTPNQEAICNDTCQEIK